MSLKIRLTRLGDKGNAFYRVVVADSRSPRDGKFIEVLGTYDPKLDGSDAVKIDKDLALGWIAKGAQPTDTVCAVLKKAGIAMDEKPAKAVKTAPKTAAAKPAATKATKK